jgi:hypothetical protein
MMTVTIKSKEDGHVIKAYEGVEEARPSMLAGDLVMDLYRQGRVIDYPFTIKYWDIRIDA